MQSRKRSRRQHGNEATHSYMGSITLVALTSICHVIFWDQTMCIHVDLQKHITEYKPGAKVCLVPKEGTQVHIRTL